MTTTAPENALDLLASPATRRQLRSYVARRVRACDVEDVVQATLCDALASGRAPDKVGELTRFLRAIARFKVVDAHRAAARTAPLEGEPADAAPPVEALSLLRWAERQLPQGNEPTLRWMLREAEGDKLEAIAADEALPAPQVRQRVSRLRRWMRARWLTEIAAALVLAVVAGGALRAGRRHEVILPEVGVEGVRIDPRLVGAWRLAAFHPAAPLPAVRSALVDRLSPTLVADFDGQTLRATAAEGSFARTWAAARAGGGALEAVETSSGGRMTATYAWEGEELVVTVPSGGWAGTARFRRR